MFYYLYEIRNNLNDKIYVGVHKTKNMDDGYMGSGKVIRSAIIKHGIDNFTKVILEIFENAEAMYAREKEIVNDEFLLREDVYNLRRGGFGGFEFINKNNLNISLSEQRLRDPTLGRRASVLANKAKMDKATSDLEYAKYLKSLSLKALDIARANNPLGTFYGKIHSDETKDKMKETHKLNKRSQGEKNSQFGTRWIHSIELKMSKRILKTEILPEGWREGRKIKFN